MSVQFGRWNFEGQAPAPDYLDKVSAILAPYGPDGNESYSKGGIRILYRAFHTTKESRREKQPCISPSGAVITWDGRLDNRTELISGLRDSVNADSTDVEIVTAAYDKWGDKCLGRLIGDWTLSIWNPRDHFLLLAKDPIGTKHLYYSFDDKQLTWSTILDPLVLFAGRTFEICEEYIAGWFSCLPAAHLTPYVAIHAVPPSCSVLIQTNKRARHGVEHTITKYWDFDPSKRIRYRTDAEYEEHFRSALATAVQRRLRSDRPVLAELSGGMDSSSIVCMADVVIARGHADCPRLDTISWFDDSDPGWHEERSYFTKVEQKRGRTGYHIDLGEKKQIDKSEDDSKKSFLSGLESERWAATPDSNRNPWSGFSEHYFEHYRTCMRSQGYRVTLSGIGGEEPTGGFVPTPTPELQNLLARARFLTLARQLNAWATKMRKPQLPLLWEAIQGFFTRSLTGAGAPRDTRPVPWFYPGFVRRNHTALCGYPSRVRLFGPLPSFQNHIHGLNHLRMVLAWYGLLRLHLEMPREVRYPYLDRGMLEFAYAIPREQIVGVGKRRFLMKRALAGIVPDEFLNRKPRAVVTQESKKDTATEWPSLAEIGQHIVGSSIGIIDPNRFWGGLQKARRDEDVPVDSLRRTLFLEFWLRHLTTQGVLTNSVVTKEPEYPASLESQELQVPVRFKSSVS